jgi:tripartite-type tricarboxylate transporter receptor subunit TctC
LEGIKIDMVHYESANGAVSGLARKEGEAIIFATGMMLKAKAQGVVKPVLVFSYKRYKYAPTVPTSIEEGIVNAKVYNDSFTKTRTWAGPPGIQKERADILDNAFYSAANDPKFIEWSNKTGLQIDPLNGSDTKVSMLKYIETKKNIVPILNKVLSRKKKKK